MEEKTEKWYTEEMAIRGPDNDGTRRVRPPTPAARSNDREPDPQTVTRDARPEFIPQTASQIFEMLLRESYDTHPETRERFARRDDTEFIALLKSPELGVREKERLALMRVSHENAKKALALREAILNGTHQEPELLE